MTFQDVLSRFGGPVPAQVLARANEQLPFWISLLAVLLLGYFLARLAWLLLPAGQPQPWQPPAPLPSAVPSAGQPGDYQSIGAAHLFGRVSEQAPALSADAAATAPDTSLSLQLRGAIAADDPKFAHAIIADANGKEQVYFVNATLPGGAVVQKIEPTLVILSRGGQLEVLRLPRESGAGGAASGAVSAAPRFLNAPAIAPNVQEMVSQNAAGFLEVVRPQPFMPNGQLKGYRVYPGPNRQQFASLGLRAGDLVTEINGIALNNPTQGMEVFRSLGGATQVTVTVERDGQPQVLSLNMNQISTDGGVTQ
jgi:general secretion pathway protein C